MTNERIQTIAEALASNDELRQTVVAMEATDAAETLNKAGYDFTADELIEFGEFAKELSANGELDLEELDSVAGGSITVFAAMGGAAFLVKVCYDLGKAVGKKW